MWSKKYCDSTNCTKLTEVLGGFLEYIHFHMIPANVLMKEIHPLGIVPYHIIMNALAYQAILNIFNFSFEKINLKCLLFYFKGKTRKWILESILIEFLGTFLTIECFIRVTICWKKTSPSVYMYQVIFEWLLTPSLIFFWHFGLQFLRPIQVRWNHSNWVILRTKHERFPFFLNFFLWMYRPSVTGFQFFAY